MIGKILLHIPKESERRKAVAKSVVPFKNSWGIRGGGRSTTLRISCKYYSHLSCNNILKNNEY